jgi:two-component system NtrC family sensor kinase
MDQDGAVARITELEAQLASSLQHQKATAEILTVIASSPSDTQPVFEAVAERTMALLNCWSVIVIPYDGELLHFGAARGAMPDTERLVRQDYPAKPGSDTITGRCILSGVPINVPDVLEDASLEIQERVRARGLRAVLSVPILRDGQPIGAISASRKQAGVFAPTEVALLQAFADQAGIAIENGRLLESEQERGAELQESLEFQTATSEVLKAIAQSATDTKPVFDSIVTNAARLCEAELSAITLYDGTLNDFVALNNVNEDTAALLRAGYPRPPDHASVSGRVILTGDIVQVDDVLDDPDSTNQSRSLDNNTAPLWESP